MLTFLNLSDVIIELTKTYNHKMVIIHLEN